ncbi:MAG: ABC transporter permease [Lutispora sp.]|jgi:oligopeptide transport system permease protein|uniref:ABC transporter permease n=1 Tax=Lutispora sp. TaxID=2828727 RepID=UPI0035694C71
MEISREKFKHVGINEEKSQSIVRPSMTYWQDAWRRLKKNKIAMLGLIVIIVMTIMSIIGPMMVPYNHSDNDLSNTDQSPNSEHWFGTDDLGRDLWARVWMGARVSLFIGLMAALLDTLIGILVGGVSGFYGGKIDMLIMRFIDVMIAIPSMIFIILIMVIVGSGVVPIIISFAITGWLSMARLVRGQILQLKEQEFVLAARTLGANSSRLILRHLIPNTLGVIIVSLTMRIPSAIFTEAFLSFIGLGVKPPMSSWGQLASSGAAVLRVFPYRLFIPAFFISITMLSLNLFGDGLRDALDPRLRK